MYITLSTKHVHVLYSSRHQYSYYYWQWALNGITKFDFWCVSFFRCISVVLLVKMIDEFRFCDVIYLVYFYYLDVVIDQMSTPYGTTQKAHHACSQSTCACSAWLIKQCAVGCINASISVIYVSRIITFMHRLLKHSHLCKLHLIAWSTHILCAQVNYEQVWYHNTESHLI